MSLLRLAGNLASSVLNAVAPINTIRQSQIDWGELFDPPTTPILDSSAVAGEVAPGQGGGPLTADGPAPVQPPRAGAGHPNLSAADLHDAAHACLILARRCETDCGRDYWRQLADRLTAAAQT